MKRIPEPELMDDELQAKAYSEADFDVGHSKIIQLMDEVFNSIDISGEILDVGCGPGDVTFRVASRFPKAKITGVDGAQAMITLANNRKEYEGDAINRVDFIKAMLPANTVPKKKYDLILSTSFLHHLHQPEILWQIINEYSRPGTRIFVADLIRPESNNAAQQIVNEFASNEPDVLKEDYYNSLLAAFVPEEVEEQLHRAGLKQLSVHVDRYLIVHGEMN